MNSDFKMLKEAFRHRIAVTVAFTGHALCDALF